MAGFILTRTKTIPSGLLERRHKEFTAQHGACFTNIGGEDDLDFSEKTRHMCVRDKDSGELLIYCRLVHTIGESGERSQGFEIQKFFKTGKSIKAMRYLLQVLIEQCRRYEDGFLIADITQDTYKIFKILEKITISQQSHSRDFFGDRAIYHIRPGGIDG